MNNEPLPVPIDGEYIELNKFLKLEGLVGSGAEAKLIIREGKIQVEGEVELRVRRKLYLGAEISFEGNRYRITAKEDA